MQTDAGRWQAGARAETLCRDHWLPFTTTTSPSQSNWSWLTVPHPPPPRIILGGINVPLCAWQHIPSSLGTLAQPFPGAVGGC